MRHMADFNIKMYTLILIIYIQKKIEILSLKIKE